MSAELTKSITTIVENYNKLITVNRTLQANFRDALELLSDVQKTLDYFSDDMDREDEAELIMWNKRYKELIDRGQK